MGRSRGFTRAGEAAGWGDQARGRSLIEWADRPPTAKWWGGGDDSPSAGGTTCDRPATGHRGRDAVDRRRRQTPCQLAIAGIRTTSQAQIQPMRGILTTHARAHAPPAHVSMVASTLRHGMTQSFAHVLNCTNAPARQREACPLLAPCVAGQGPVICNQHGHPVSRPGRAFSADPECECSKFDLLLGPANSACIHWQAGRPALPMPKSMLGVQGPECFECPYPASHRRDPHKTHHAKRVIR